ncbi:MAG: type II toxin-antitoxin system RelE/ParE family toxin [Solirubrobacterales bacterium]|nr:type II toxin-antitoxin system RelE/ParE family toxin [Solirubrobacterales bacterium]
MHYSQTIPGLYRYVERRSRARWQPPARTSASLERAVDVHRRARRAEGSAPARPAGAARIVDALDRFVADPFSGDIRRLNAIEWRLRVGDWRVRFAFDDEERVIVVLRVLPRGRAYDR